MSTSLKKKDDGPARSCCPKCGEALIRTGSTRPLNPGQWGRYDWDSPQARFWRCPSGGFGHGAWRPEDPTIQESNKQRVRRQGRELFGDAYD